MLKLRFICRTAVAAAALCAAQPLLAQSGGLGVKLDEAEKKLDADIKACRPIDPKEYQQLAIDANRNARAAIDAIHAGAPIDSTQVNADLQRATALFDRARAAAEKPCPPPQQKPQQAAQPEKKVEPPKPQTPVAGGQPGQLPRDPFYEFEDDADDAMDDLERAIKNCDADAVKKLIPKLEEMAKRAHEIAKAAKAAGKFSKIDPTYADDLAWDLDWAVFAAKNFKCPVKPKEPEQPKQTTPAPQPKEEPKPQPGLAPAPQKTGIEEYNDIKNSLPGVLLSVRNDSTNCALYKFWEWDVARLEELARRARALANAAKAAGPYSQVDAGEAEKLARQAEDDLAKAKKNPPPKCPQPQQPKVDKTSQRILDIHNEERFAVHAQPLRWNFQLQQDATAYAQVLARTHQLVHAPREGRGIERENLGTGLIGSSPDQIVEIQWIGEKRFFHAGFFPEICSGEWTQCAHYSQVIWPTTTDLGCGWAMGGGYEWVVCRYSPGGNKGGKPVGLFAGNIGSVGTVEEPTAAPCHWIEVKTGKPVASGPIVGNVNVNGSRPQPNGPPGFRTYKGDSLSTDVVPVAVRPDATDPNRAYDPESGRNFFFDSKTCSWKDAKTGKPVASGPIVGNVNVNGSRPQPNGPPGFRTYKGDSLSTDVVPVAGRPDATDPNRAYDPESGRNFAKVPVEPKQPYVPERG